MRRQRAGSSQEVHWVSWGLRETNFKKRLRHDVEYYRKSVYPGTTDVSALTGNFSEALQAF